MTEKLYDVDSHLSVFKAKVLSCKEENGFFYIELDQTAFFPEGGGQSGDTGVIGDVAVLDTQITENIIFHKTKEKIEVGKAVGCRINWDQRFRRMQNHSGEHIVSGLIHNHFGYENVGFHMGHEDMTIDLNGYLTAEELSKIEKEANQIVWKNVPIKTEYPDAESLEMLEYRSKLDLTENVRIVTIKDVDRCACCAPHVSYTGEIGLIKIVDSLRYKGGIRIHLLCGEDAFDDAGEKQEALRKIAVAMSAKQKEAPQSFEKLMGEMAELKRALHNWKAELIKAKVETIRETEENLCFFEPLLDADAMRELVNKAVDKCSGLCAVFSGNDKNGYFYVIGSKNQSVSARAKEINNALNGRGGGRDPMIQGNVKASESEIKDYFLNN